MQLKIYRTQSESSGILAGKKCVYSLKIVAHITAEESQLLTKYGYLNKTTLVADPEAFVALQKELKGPRQVSLGQLKTGVQWTCTFLPESFANIPAAIQSWAEDLLRAAAFREAWGGEEVIEIG